MRFLFTASLLLAGSIVWGEASAESVRRFIDVGDIPLEGGSFFDFVPPGWRVEVVISGDLNRDTKPDTVLELIEDLPATVDGVANERYRALLVLLETQADRLRRVAVAARLLRCSTCFGMMAGPEGGGAEIKIDKGVLIVDEVWGSRETVHTALRFRYDPINNRMPLIGEDIVRFDRATGAHLRESRNFITGIKVTEGTRYDAKIDRLTGIPTQKRHTPRIRRVIEDIDYKDYER